jgi:hypothetical protein
MLPWFRSGHPSANHPLETTAVLHPREAVFASRASVRRDATQVCGSTPFCQFAPAYRDKIVPRRNAGEFTNRRGEGFFIARRFISAVCLLVYKGKQFEGNSLQSVAKQELPDKSLAYGERRSLGCLTRTERVKK